MPIKKSIRIKRISKNQLLKANNVSIKIAAQINHKYSSSFELFKSNVCHRVKEMGDVQFIAYILKNDSIRDLYKKKEYPESLYLLAMLDYLSRINDIPLCINYNDLRRCRLRETIYPKSILVAYAVQHRKEIKEDAYRNSIPEFIRFNIVENEVHNVF